MVIARGVDEGELLRLVAAVEREAEHPLADVVERQAEATQRVTEHAEGSENVPGHGAIATVSGHRVVVGNRRLTERENIDLTELAAQRDQLAATGRTVVIAAVDGRAAGLIASPTQRAGPPPPSWPSCTPSESKWSCSPATTRPPPSGSPSSWASTP
ncbi:cation transport ATPase [Streptomyces sp. SAI-218]